MRSLPALVGVEAVVLVLLLGVWWSRQGDVVLPPPGGGGHGPSVAASAEPVVGAAGVREGEPASAAIEREAAMLPAADAAAGLAVVLQGRLISDRPLPEVNRMTFRLRRGDDWRLAEISAVGAYAACGLTKGTWRITCEVPGCRRIEFDHTLTGAKIQRLDIELQAAVVLPVFVRTADDKRLQAELSKLGFWQGMNVVATAAPLPGDLEPVENSSVSLPGVGRHRQTGDLNQRANADGDDGVLELDQPPPVYAAVLLRHMVLAQQRIEPGQQELRFVVDIAEVEKRFAKVRMRVVGADGRPAAANVELSTAQGGGKRGKADENGVVVIEKVLPGLASFSIYAKECEQYWTHLSIASGADVDLGDVVLTAPSKLLGRVVDAEGKPAGASLQWTAIDQWRAPHPMVDRRGTSSDGDGNFEIGGGQRRYSVRARTQEGLVGFATVDGAAAGTERFVVTVRKTHALRLRADGQHVRVAMVADTNGVPLAVVRLELRWPEASCALPDGEYQLSIYDGYGARLSHESLRVAGADIDKELQ